MVSGVWTYKLRLPNLHYCTFDVVDAETLHGLRVLETKYLESLWVLGSDHPDTFDCTTPAEHEKHQTGISPCRHGISFIGDNVWQRQYADLPIYQACLH